MLTEAEDVTICRTFRTLLEREHAIRFATESQADQFAFEAAYPIGLPFGFHGLYNFCRVVPEDELTALVVHFTPAIARSPQLAQLGRNCLALGQWRAAAAIFQRILDDDPANRVAAAGLATARSSMASVPAAGRNDPCPCGSGKRYKNCHGALAASAPQPGAASAPPPAAALDLSVQQAIALHQQGDTAAAERIYREALAVQPGHPLAQHFLGVILYQRQDVAAALPLLQRSVEAVPAEPEFHNNLGLALAAGEREEEAIAAFRAALALKSGHAVAWNNLGLALQSVNDVDGAIGAFRRAIALQPEFEHAHWNLALALLLDGQYAEGWREYESRFALSELGKDRHVFAGPAWDGSAPTGQDLAALHRAGSGRCLAIRALRRAAGKDGRALHRLLSASAGAFARHGSGRRADGQRRGSAAALRRASAAAVAAQAARHDGRRDPGGRALHHRRAGAACRGAQADRGVAATAQRRHRLDRQSGQSGQSHPFGRLWTRSIRCSKSKASTGIRCNKGARPPISPRPRAKLACGPCPPTGRWSTPRR